MPFQQVATWPKRLGVRYSTRCVYEKFTTAAEKSKTPLCSSLAKGSEWRVFCLESYNPFEYYAAEVLQLGQTVMRFGRQVDNII